jgi:hypothetical protein
MVEALTESRHDLFEQTSQKLSAVIEKLESTVSELPGEKLDLHLISDNASDAEDPTELFHRDIGTQTSTPPSPVLGDNLPDTKNDAPGSASAKQTRDLNELVSSLKDIRAGLTTDAEEVANTRTVIDVLRDELEVLTYPPKPDFVGGYSLYGNANKNEPDDEIRRAKENIRRIKGVLLSTRNFPTSAR